MSLSGIRILFAWILVLGTLAVSKIFVLNSVLVGFSFKLHKILHWGKSLVSKKAKEKEKGKEATETQRKIEPEVVPETAPAHAL